MKTRFIIISVLLLLSVPSCTVTMREGPPPPVVQVVPPPPSVVHVWVPGYYRVHRGRYVWVPGYYRVPPRRRTVWVVPRYEQRPGGYRYRTGHWRRH